MDLYNHFEKRIRDIRNQRPHRPLKPEEIRQIALDLGMTEDEWQQLQETAAAHRARGQGFLKHGTWDEAVAELSRAAALYPDHLDTMFLLAQAYRGRWLAEHAEVDRQQAVDLARRCLEVEPAHDPSLVMVGELEAEVEKQHRKIWTLAACGVAVVVMAAVLAVFLFARQQDRAPVQAETPAPNSLPNKPPTVPETAPRELTPILGLPVRFISGDKSTGLDFRPEASDYNKYNAAYSYALRGDLTVRGIEVENLKLRIELEDESGTVVVTGFAEVLANYQPVARSGDIIPCWYTYFNKSTDFPNLKEAVVSVESIARRPAAPSYDPSPELDINWPNQPLNVDLKIRQRRANVTQGYLFKPEDSGLRLVLEVENTGRTTLKTVALLIKCFDQQDRLVAEAKKFVTISSYPRLKPGQTRVVGAIVPLKNLKTTDFKGYTLTVLEAE